jgi:hypothetical protein
MPKRELDYGTLIATREDRDREAQRAKDAYAKLLPETARANAAERALDAVVEQMYRDYMKQCWSIDDRSLEMIADAGAREAFKAALARKENRGR